MSLRSYSSFIKWNWVTRTFRSRAVLLMLDLPEDLDRIIEVYIDECEKVLKFAGFTDDMTTTDYKVSRLNFIQQLLSGASVRVVFSLKVYRCSKESCERLRDEVPSLYEFMQ